VCKYNQQQAQQDSWSAAGGDVAVFFYFWSVCTILAKSILKKKYPNNQICALLAPRDGPDWGDVGLVVVAGSA